MGDADGGASSAGGSAPTDDIVARNPRLFKRKRRERGALLRVHGHDLLLILYV